MRIMLNGAAHEVPEGSVLADLVAPTPGIAVAVNGDVVRGWDRVLLVEGDAVEIVTAFQGG